MASRQDDPELLVRLLDHAPTSIFLVDGEAAVLWVNRSAADLFGFDVDEVIGRSVLEFLDPDWDPIAFESIATAMGAEGPRQPMLFRAIRADGSKMIVEVIANAQLHDPVLGGLVVALRRWDERYLLDQVLESMAASAEAEHTLRLLVRVAEADILEARAAILFDRVGDRFASVQASAGLDPALVGPMAGQPADVLEAWAGLLPHDDGVVADVADLPEVLRRPAEAAGHQTLWLWPSDRRPGEAPDVVVAAWRDEPHLDVDQTRRWAMARLARLASLVLDRSRSDAARAYAASHDALTGLANRAWFYERLERAVAVKDADAGPRQVGVVYLDLDGFKPINDQHGHAVGDEVLVEVGVRLAALVRDDEVVARLGGDEFAVLCPSVTGLEALGVLAGRLGESIRRPIEIDGASLSVGVSAGCAVGVAGECSADALVEAADVAMYEAKADGKGGWRLALVPGGEPTGP